MTVPFSRGVAVPFSVGWFISRFILSRSLSTIVTHPMDGLIHSTTAIVWCCHKLEVEYRYLVAQRNTLLPRPMSVEMTVGIIKGSQYKGAPIPGNYV